MFKKQIVINGCILSLVLFCVTLACENNKAQTSFSSDTARTSQKDKWRNNTEEEDQDSEWEKGVCAAEELNFKRCEDDVLKRCDGIRWVNVADCSLMEPAHECYEHSTFAGVADCRIPDVSLWEACKGQDLENNCEQDLICTESSFLNAGIGNEGDFVCVDECTSNDDCDPGYYCDTFLKENEYASDNLCFAIVDKLNFCFHDEGCSAENNECVPWNGIAGQCMQACEHENLGISEGCEASEKCLISKNSVEFETNTSGDFVYCGPNDTGCSSGYDCMALTEERRGTNLTCARPSTFCGVEGLQHLNFTWDGLNAAIDAWYEGEPSFCEDSYNNVLCNSLDGFEGHYNCVTTGIGLWYYDANNEPIRCESDADCMFYNAACIGNWDDVDFSVCTEELHVCTAICELDYGIEIECPAGQHCIIPEFGDLETMEGGIHAMLPCTTSTDCSESFECKSYTNGHFCARFAKVCAETEQ